MIRSGGVALALVFALMAAACSGDDSESLEPSRLAVTQNARVAAILGTPVTESDVEAESKAIHQRIEELTAQCMSAAGFDYVPVPFEVGRARQVPQTDTSFGQTDQFFAVFSADFEAPTERDPNVEIRAALSDDEGLAYEQALNGDGALFDPRLDSLESIQEAARTGAIARSGCRFSSQERAIDETERNLTLIGEYGLLRDGMVNTDQRMIRARVEWASCMAEAGFTYRDESAIHPDLLTAAARLMSELQDEGVELEPLEDPPAPVLARIDELREYERQVAGAHATCRQITDEALAEVLADVDAIFLERHS